MTSVSDRTTVFDITMQKLATADNYEKVDTLVSDTTLHLFEWICYSIICESIDIFGTTTNIINIICFVKLGFKDPVNVSLMGLAISDLGCLITLLWTNICLNPAFSAADLPFQPLQFQYLTAGWPHVIFTRVTAWITAFITLERCLCIIVPLKVQHMITPKRVWFIIASIFVALLSGAVPVYAVNRLAMVWNPELNKTLIGLVYTENRETVEIISFSIIHVIVPFTSFGVIITCTVILVVKLRKNTKWRKQTVNITQCSNVSVRDKKIAKMVVAISGLFIACFTPVCINFIAMSMESELSVDGRYKNTLITIIGVGFLLESVNSSVNIFIYYHMSSKYKAVFSQIFRACLNNESSENKNIGAKMKKNFEHY